MKAMFKILYQNQPKPDLLTEEINYFQLDGRDNYLYMKACDGTRYKSTKTISDEDYIYMAEILLENNIINFITNNAVNHVMFMITEDDEEDYEDDIIDTTESNVIDIAQ